MLCDSVMDHVHGAAVHGTMLYEDGRNGDSLPVFRDITMENITAHGGDYGVFLEAFPEVPITGLVMRNITIDGVRQCLRSMNWKDAVVENVTINGKRFPRPGYVRILGVPYIGGTVTASAESCGAQEPLTFCWEASEDNKNWTGAAGERPSPCLTGRHTSGSAPQTLPETGRAAAATGCCRHRRREPLPGCTAVGCWTPRSWSGAASQ